MTAPVDITAIVPLRYKTVIGLIGSLLSFLVPFILSVQQYLPTPWPAVIGAVLAVLTALGIYHAPYEPAGTTLAPDTVEVAAASAAGGTPSPPLPYQPGDPDSYRNPWR